MLISYNIMSIPNFLKQIAGDTRLSTSQKMVAIMAFMPNVPEIKTENFYELGVTIQKLIEDNKIELGKFDDDFILDVKKNI